MIQYDIQCPLFHRFFLAVLRLGHLVDALGSGIEALPLGLLAAPRTWDQSGVSEVRGTLYGGPC